VQVTRSPQLSIHLENRVGALAEICEVIAEQCINLVAICAIDTVEEAVLRIVPEDAPVSRTALESRGFKVIETQVLVIELPNTPGATGRAAADLAGAGVNIDYIYASAHPESNKAILVLRTHQEDEALTVLQDDRGN